MPNKLNYAQTKAIAQLAKLDLNDEEIEKYAQELSKILKFVEQIATADTNNISPTFHTENQKQRLRDDIVTQKMSDTDIKALQKNAPQIENNLYLVPKIIENPHAS